MNFAIPAKRLQLKSPLLLILFSLAAGFVASLVVTPPANAAYENLSSSLPDDSYRLYRNGNPVGSSNECYNAAKQGICTAGNNPSSGGSHQYITISTGSINDDNHPPKDNEDFIYDSVYMAIYTKTPSNKSLSLDMVDRGVGTTRGCSGYKIGVGYMDGNSIPLNVTDTISPSPNGDNCQRSYGMHYFPKNGFTALVNADGSFSGVYMGVIMLRIPSGTHPSKQASFHFSTSGAKLGYVGDQKIENGEVTYGNTNAVNIYPTNAANGHKIIYRFAPPCNMPPNTGFEISWDDANEGTQYQTSNMPLRIYKQHRDGSNKTQIASPNAGNNWWTHDVWVFLKTSNYAPGTPYSYSVEFDNVHGGNGISLRYPFDSANSVLDCDSNASKKWKLDPGTAVSRQIGAYSPKYADVGNSNARRQANVARAKAAFDDARFKHYVDEVGGQRAAKSGEHRWTIDYRIKRGNDPTWKTYSKGGSLNNLTANVPAARTAVLEDASRVNVNSDQMKYLFRNSSDTAYRNPVIGDTYCERVNNNPGSNKNGTVINDPSGWKCVELSGNPPCVSEAWNVRSASSVTGDGDPSSAWVGQTYRYNYAFWKTGPANQTGVINFYHNSPAPTHSQQLGTWNPSYPRGIAASNGGQTLTDYMAYQPTQGFTNCTTGGANLLSGSIFVPYYYHLTSSTANVGSRTEQGSQVEPKLDVSLPSIDTAGDRSGEAASDSAYGRLHTYSAPTNGRIIEFKTNDINSAKAAIPKNKSGGSGSCPEMASYGIAGFRDCGVVTEVNGKVYPIGNSSMAYTRPPKLDPVGTHICYVGAINRPIEQDDNFGTAEPPGWRYSTVSCTTIIKSPKVQFQNGDLTVGRHRKGDGGPPCAPPIASASIRATGAPVGVYVFNFPRPNLYGSWVEYGAFAPGNISGFGTAAYAQTSTAPGAHKKLMFSNTPSSGGYDNYGAKCLSNPFDLVKEPDVTSIDAEAPDLKLNEYFTSPGHNTSADDKTGYVANGKNIVINPATSGTSYTATVTIEAAAEGFNIGPDKACPTIKVSLKQGDGTSSAQNVCVNHPSASGSLGSYSLTYNLGSQGYKGPQGLKIDFLNDYAGGDGNRNVHLGKVTVKFSANGSTSTIDAKDPPLYRRAYDPAAAPGDPAGNNCHDDSQSVKNGRLFLAQDQNTASRDGGQWCYGYKLDKAELTGLTEEAPPPGTLNDNFSAFKGRDIILYAKKGPGTCGSPSVGGNIMVNTDISYAKLGYGDISQLPRVIFLADCKIIIDDTVSKVDAWLIAKDAVETCSEDLGNATGNKFRNKTVTHFDCTNQLTVNGPVQAKRLLLWRTHGSDLTLADSAEAAEIFDLRPDQVLATYARGRDAGKPQTVFQTDLPPLY